MPVLQEYFNIFPKQISSLGEKFVNKKSIKAAKVVFYMAQRGIREYDAKNLLARYLPEYLNDFSYKGNNALVGPETDLEELESANPWLKTTKLVVKPDQLFGKRGKLGLVLLDADWEKAKRYLKEKMGLEVAIGGITGRLSHFFIEPFTPHKEEFYVAISSDYEGDNIFFSMVGGVGVEENWDRVVCIHVDPLEGIDALDVGSRLPDDLGDKKTAVEKFISALWRFYSDTGFAYLEINPFTFIGKNIVPLDIVAKLDDAEEYWQRNRWSSIAFPGPFGKTPSKEEMSI